jgi:hypothetical protein
MFPYSEIDELLAEQNGRAKYAGARNRDDDAGGCAKAQSLCV